MIITSEGIVLNRRNVGETDIIFDLLLIEGKMIGLKVHGILASKKRSALIAEPGCRVSVTYYPRENGPGSLKEGHIIDRYEELKSCYENMVLLSYLLELTKAAARGNESSELYTLLYGAMNEIRNWKIDLRNLQKKSSTIQFDPLNDTTVWLFLLLGFFKVRVLKLLGILSDSSYCSGCGSRIKERAAWKFPEVSFYCNECDLDANIEEGWMAAAIYTAASMKFGRFLEGSIAPPLDIFEILYRWDNQLGKCLEYYYSDPCESGIRLYNLLLNKNQ